MNLSTETKITGADTHPIDRKDYVGRYEREMNVSLERMYENTLDWEHLPYLHSSTFYSLDLNYAGPGGWRAKVQFQPTFLGLKSEVEMIFIKKLSRWVVTTLDGVGKGTEVWTTAVPLGENRIKVVVDFFSPKTSAVMKFLLRGYSRNLYKKLYNEDEAMMLERQVMLDLKRKEKAGGSSVQLGKLEEVKAKLPLPFEFQSHRFMLNETDGKLSAHSLVCPHLLGPLEYDKEDPSRLHCPWHDYKFDPTTGKCTAGNEKLKLKKPPQVTVDEAGLVIVS